MPSEGGSTLLYRRGGDPPKKQQVRFEAQFRDECLAHVQVLLVRVYNKNNKRSCYGVHKSTFRVMPRELVTGTPR